MTSLAEKIVKRFKFLQDAYFKALRNQPDLKSQEVILLYDIQIQMSRYREQKDLGDYDTDAKKYLEEMYAEIKDLFTKVGKIRFELAQIDCLEKDYHKSLCLLRSLELTPEDAYGNNLAIRQMLENAKLSISSDKLKQREYHSIAQRINNLSK